MDKGARPALKAYLLKKLDEVPPKKKAQRLVEVARLAVLGTLQEELPGIAVLVVDADLFGVSWVVAFEAWHYRDCDCLSLLSHYSHHSLHHITVLTSQSSLITHHITVFTSQSSLITHHCFHITVITHHVTHHITVITHYNTSHHSSCHSSHHNKHTQQAPHIP